MMLGPRLPKNSEKPIILVRSRESELITCEIPTCALLSKGCAMESRLKNTPISTILSVILPSTGTSQVRPIIAIRLGMPAHRM